jgi:hypothetical protein
MNHDKLATLVGAGTIGLIGICAVSLVVSLSSLGSTPAKSSATPVATSQPTQPTAPVTNWRYGANTDTMDGSVTKWAMNDSTNKVSMKFPYNGGTGATIVVFDDKNVKIRMSQGQVLCPSYGGCEIRVKFDDGKVETFLAYGASSAEDSKTIWIYSANSGKFINKLKTSKKVMVELRVYQEGSPVFEFDVAEFRQPN